MVEREAPRVQERPVEPERSRVVAASAVGSVAEDRMTDRLAGAPGSGGSVRSEGLRRAASREAKRSPTSNPVSASRPSVRSTTIRSARRPSGASTANVVVLDTTPRTSARYRRSTACARIRFASGVVRLVGLRDDHEPGRAGVEPMHDARDADRLPPLDSGMPMPSSRLTSVPVRRSLCRVRDRARRASRSPADARPRTARAPADPRARADRPARPRSTSSRSPPCSR